ncbi:peptidyl-alpha-hydroxyglycine alpha-amidating lyase family protein [Streptomyces radicis]|uniref:peptidylamidoglycolate lyase n=1 Tax=Streptomyces radicis TaxID=1750517 RepID=A0A3A9WLW8_9ACTN|nr:peptidyl-alpha-hydroxyglycine alpha-amidating lyase family protein [Streptomyces radicis]RKN10464.1 peptidylglycine alpha-amidating monooxygenase [Streptomyces radicis]RKN24723.1 peptidylglycine alpha-amidating monooxygenase [Streptomyces radicis]
MAVGPATAETRYEPVPYWAKIPHGIWLKEATSVAVDSQDRVYVFNRGNMPVLVFDRDGNVVDMWGNETPFAGTELFEDPYGNLMPRWKGCRFARAHAITVDHEDRLWLVDDLGNRITKTDRHGTALLTLGSGEPSGFQSGEPFNRPTDVAISPVTGDVFVTDGYRNSRVHRFDAEGRHVASWGEPGTDPGQFSLPHNVAMFGDDAVIVCDRENHRVQVFSLDGEFVAAWHAHKAVAVCAGRGEDTNVYVAEQGPPPVQHGVPNLGHRIRVMDREGRRVASLGADLPGEEPDRFNWPHSVAVDSEGSVYAAEVSYVEVGSKETPPREMVSLRKWRRARG